MSYSRAPVKAPKLSGVALRAFVSAVESGVGPALLKKLVTDSGLEVFRNTSAGHASPIQVPLPVPAPPATPPGTPQAMAERAANAAQVAKGSHLTTVADFAQAFRSGSSDPTSVARRLNEAITRLDGRDDSMAFFISRKPEEVTAAAEAAAERWRQHQPLSVLDGVPVVVKDEVDLAGFATTLGTKFRTQSATRDSTVVARLKAAGAVILGKANMNEIGISPVGLNPHYGPPRNPHHRGHITGGSSSGSAAVVAAGLCPVAIGADGGGSIRIPSALCGVVGLKATFGRISEHGVPPLCWNVGHVGPIGATVADVAVAYALIAGKDAGDPVSLGQPPPHLDGFERLSLEGVRLGICTPYFDDASADVVARCRDAVKACTDAGATVVELPVPDLNTILWSHSIIILSEMSAAMREDVQRDTSQFALDSRINLAIGRHFRGTDLVHAMRHRHKLTWETLELLSRCDAIVTPTTATTAPLMPEGALPDGESNLPLVDELMRYVRVGNLTGCPALAVPCGYDSNGLPTSIHFMGRPWEEDLLFRLGRVVEASVERRKPQVHVSALG